MTPMRDMGVESAEHPDWLEIGLDINAALGPLLDTDDQQQVQMHQPMQTEPMDQVLKRATSDRGFRKTFLKTGG